MSSDNVEKLLNIAQDKAVEDFIKNKNIALNPFPCGLGKTIIALKTVKKLKVKTLIIVEPKLYPKFLAEAKKWLTKEEFKLVTWYKHSELSKKTNQLFEDIKKTEPVFVITDEVHNFKETNTSRGATWGRLCNWKSVKYHMMMSATPIVNQPEGIYTILKACKLVGKGKSIRNKTDFLLSFFYCVRVQIERCTILQPKGYRNPQKEAELFEILKSVSLVTEVKELLKLFPVIQEYLLYSEDVAIEYNDLDLGERATYLKEIAPQRFDSFNKYVEDAIKKKLRIVIYYVHRNLGELLSRRYKLTPIAGETPVPKRNKIIKAFNEGKSNILLGSMLACSSGLDFFGVDRIYCFERTFSDARNMQALYRARRFGEKSGKMTIPAVYFTYRGEATLKKSEEKKIIQLKLNEALYS